MKLLKTATLVLILSLSFVLQAQEPEASNDTKIDKKSYYQKRAAEDAKYEQQFKAETKAEEEAFWEEQKEYERDLKRKDRIAYKAYMQGKKDAYAEHYEHCDAHCHHGYHYYHHASFYYYRYDDYYYNRYSGRGTSVNTRVRLNTPRVRVGLGL